MIFAEDFEREGAATSGCDLWQSLPQSEGAERTHCGGLSEGTGHQTEGPQEEGQGHVSGGTWAGLWRTDQGMVSTFDWKDISSGFWCV